jgi:hypothetical protein
MCYDTKIGSQRHYYFYAKSGHRSVTANNLFITAHQSGSQNQTGARASNEAQFIY